MARKVVFGDDRVVETPLRVTGVGDMKSIGAFEAANEIELGRR